MPDEPEKFLTSDQVVTPGDLLQHIAAQDTELANLRSQVAAMRGWVREYRRQCMGNVGLWPVVKEIDVMLARAEPPNLDPGCEGCVKIGECRAAYTAPEGPWPYECKEPK